MNTLVLYYINLDTEIDYYDSKDIVLQCNNVLTTSVDKTHFTSLKCNKNVFQAIPIGPRGYTVVKGHFCTPPPCDKGTYFAHPPPSGLKQLSISEPILIVDHY